jgi:hypothetical protein
MISAALVKCCQINYLSVKVFELVEIKFANKNLLELLIHWVSSFRRILLLLVFRF